MQVLAHLGEHVDPEHAGKRSGLLWLPLVPVHVCVCV